MSTKKKRPRVSEGVGRDLAGVLAGASRVGMGPGLDSNQRLAAFSRPLYRLSYQAREVVPREGLEPPCPRAAVPKTAVSAVSPSRRENGRGQHGS